MANTAGPKQYSKRQTQQPRKAKNTDDDTGKALKLIGGGALGMLAAGSAGILAQGIADKMYPMTSQKYQERTGKLKRSIRPDKID